MVAIAMSRSSYPSYQLCKAAGKSHEDLEAGIKLVDNATRTCKRRKIFSFQFCTHLLRELKVVLYRGEDMVVHPKNQACGSPR